MAGVYAVGFNGEWLGTGTPIESWVGIDIRTDGLMAGAMEFSKTSPRDLFVVTGERSTGNGYQNITLHRFHAHVTEQTKPTRVTDWADSGKKTYSRGNCTYNSSPPLHTLCALQPTAIATDPSGNHVYIGGSTPWADGDPNSANRDLFLLKADAPAACAPTPPSCAC